MATNGAGIDPVVRDRVIAQIQAFEEALDEAADDPSADAQDVHVTRQPNAAVASPSRQNTSPMMRLEHLDIKPS
jgi:hypothetical protein